MSRSFPNRFAGIDETGIDETGTENPLEGPSSKNKVDSNKSDHISSRVNLQGKQFRSTADTCEQSALKSSCGVHQFVGEVSDANPCQTSLLNTQFFFHA